MIPFPAKIICAIALALSTFPAFAQPKLPVFRANENIVSVLEQNGHPVLVTNQYIYRVSKKKWVLWLETPLPVQTTAVSQGRLWVGGNKGLYWLDADAQKWRQWTALPGLIPVNTLRVDQMTDDLLVASSTQGAFVLHNTDLLHPFVQNTETQVVCSCGNYQWIGTPAGLLRLDAQGNIQKYAEEGVMGFEIPDNIVENLFCSRSQVLTVVSPEPLAFLPIPSKGAPAHGPHFDYLGSAGNEIFNQLELPNGDYLFLTAHGLLRLSTGFLRNPTEEMGNVEVHDDRNNPKAIVLPVSHFTDDPILQKEIWRNGFWDKQGNLWLMSNQKILRIKKRQLKQA